LLSVGAGAFTSLFITGLFKLSNYFTRYKPRYRRNAVEVQTQPREAQYTAAIAARHNSTPSDAAADDWASDSTDDDDWDFDEDADKTRG